MGAAGKPSPTRGSNQVTTARQQAEVQIQQQLDELRRWRAVMLGREQRVLRMQRAVNKLLAQLDLPPHYAIALPAAAGPAPGSGNRLPEPSP